MSEIEKQYRHMQGKDGCVAGAAGWGALGNRRVEDGMRAIMIGDRGERGLARDAGARYVRGGGEVEAHVNVGG